MSTDAAEQFKEMPAGERLNEKNCVPLNRSWQTSTLWTKRMNGQSIFDIQCGQSFIDNKRWKIHDGESFVWTIRCGEPILAWTVHNGHQSIVDMDKLV